MSPGVRRYNNKLGVERLVRTAKKMGLGACPDMIWGLNKLTNEVVYIEINQELLDELKYLYWIDGHQVDTKKGEVVDAHRSCEHHMKRTVTLEEFRELRAEGKEPKVKFYVRKHESDDNEEWDFGELADSHDGYSFDRESVARQYTPEAWPKEPMAPYPTKGIFDSRYDPHMGAYDNTVSRDRKAVKPVHAMPSKEVLATYERVVL